MPKYIGEHPEIRGKYLFYRARILPLPRKKIPYDLPRLPLKILTLFFFQFDISLYFQWENSV